MTGTADRDRDDQFCQLLFVRRQEVVPPLRLRPGGRVNGIILIVVGVSIPRNIFLTTPFLKVGVFFNCKQNCETV